VLDCLENYITGNYTSFLHSFRRKLNNFHDLLKQRLSSLCHVVGTVASLTIQSMYLDFKERILASWSPIWHPELMLHSTTASLSI
jgi:hypothetical protein